MLFRDLVLLPMGKGDRGSLVILAPELGSDVMYKSRERLACSLLGLYEMQREFSFARPV